MQMTAIRQMKSADLLTFKHSLLVSPQYHDKASLYHFLSIWLEKTKKFPLFLFEIVRYDSSIIKKGGKL